MKYFKANGINTKLSRLGLGCWQLGGHGWGQVSEDDLMATVAKALECGISLYDTAPIYGLGRSEELLARALGPRRKDTIIATKVGLKWHHKPDFEKQTDSSPRRIRQEIEASLLRLKTDYIDIYQIHWPDSKTPVQETMSALEDLRQRGLIHAIGFCNSPFSMIEEARNYGQVEFVQVPYNLIDRKAEMEMMPYCLENKISVIAYSPLAKGLLSGKYSRNSAFGTNDIRSRHDYFSDKSLEANLRTVEKVREVAGKLNRTPAQVALRWVMTNPAVSCAIFGAKNPAQVAENTAAFDFDLSQIDREFLDRGI